MDQSSKNPNTAGDLEHAIEERVGALDPDLEVIAVERPAAEALRIFIDHPEGIKLEHCERVTTQLRDLLAEYALEVSSPGLDRPLTKPSHFERFLGHEVRVRTTEPISGQRNFTGRLAAAGPEAIAIDSGEGPTEIPLDRVRRSNLVPQLSEVHQ
jgi:ribosome maturation factor RimP